MSRRGRGAGSFGFVFLLFIIIAVIARRSGNERSEESEDGGGNSVAAVSRQLTPEGTVTAREGIAALVLMDVSGSMADSVRAGGARRPKIEIAREAALTLVRQFDAYGKAHPEETVLVGLMEFSERPPASAREVIPLSPADPARAEKALATMTADGGTPIGDAMIAGKRALDQTGLSRRHLLVITDGENTDGVKPVDVMKALSQRPETERPSIYFVAFDIEASRFNRVRESGSLVLPAADAEELNRTLDSLLTGKILVEGP